MTETLENRYLLLFGSFLNCGVTEGVLQHLFKNATLSKNFRVISSMKKASALDDVLLSIISPLAVRAAK